MEIADLFAFVPIASPHMEHPHVKSPYIIETDEARHDLKITKERPPSQPQQTIEEKDAQLKEIQELIEKKRHFLWEKRRELRDMSVLNQFMEQVKHDYSKYNSYITGQKVRQMQAMTMLTEYLEGLREEGVLSEQNMQDALAEQERIRTELAAIKANLDDIIDHDLGSSSGSGSDSDSDSDMEDFMSIASSDISDTTTDG